MHCSNSQKLWIVPKLCKDSDHNQTENITAIADIVILDIAGHACFEIICDSTLLKSGPNQLCWNNKPKQILSLR